MKKSFMTPKTADKIVAAVLFIAGILTLQVYENSLTTNILGICFLIAAIYGFLLISKKKVFLFRN